MLKKRKNRKSKKPYRRPATEKLIKDNINEIEVFMKNDVPMGDIALYLNMAPPTFSESFKNIYKMSPIDYKKKISIKKVTLLSQKLWELAIEKNDRTMLIWLSKNWLGYTETGRAQESVENESKEIELFEMN